MSGRWPANTVLTHLPWCPPDGCAPGCVVAQLDEQSGESTTGGVVRNNSRGDNTIGLGLKPNQAFGHDDTGGASRFFPTFRYTAEDFDLLGEDDA